MANDPTDKVRELQRALYRAAKRSATRRFHALYDKVYREDILATAWEIVRANRGVAGVDGQTIQDIEAGAVGVFLTQLQGEMKEGRYRPQPVRRVYIPKPDGRQRPLGIAAVRDRVVQAAVKIVVEPIFEADFQPCSYGFRPKRSAHEANETIRQGANQGYDCVVDADIESYFDTIDRVKLIRKFVEAGVLEEGKARTAGTPQGGVLSPLLANIYLNYLEKVWEDRCSRIGVLVRYADDLVILCRSKTDAQEALRRLRIVMERLRLKLHPVKTRLVNLKEGSTFWVSLAYGRYYLQRWPGRKAMKAIREKVRTIIGTRSQLPKSLREVISEVNPVLRGWGNYFRVGNSTKHFKQVDSYVRGRLYLFLSEKHGKSGRGWGQRWESINFRQEGLYYLNGAVCWHGTAASAAG